MLHIFIIPFIYTIIYLPRVVFNENWLKYFGLIEDNNLYYFLLQFIIFFLLFYFSLLYSFNSPINSYKTKTFLCHQKQFSKNVFRYMGFALIDQPSTDISRYFYIAAKFIENGINSGGKYINSVILIYCHKFFLFFPSENIKLRCFIFFISFVFQEKCWYIVSLA